MVGGGGKVVLSFAAREADIVSINNVPFGPTEDGLTPQQEAVRRLDHVRAAAGERLAGLDIEASPFFTAVSDDAAAAARIAALVDFPAEPWPTIPTCSSARSASSPTAWRSGGRPTGSTT